MCATRPHRWPWGSANAWTLSATCLLLFGCGSDPIEEAGRFEVASHAIQTTDDARDRPLELRLYAPTRSDASSVALSSLAAEQQQQLADLVDGAPQGCPSRELQLAPDEPYIDRSWPLVVYSHCHECLGLSGASVATRLASQGFAVLTVDHDANTLWNKLDGDGVALGEEFLDTREADLSFAIDFALDGGLQLGIDPDRVGVAGHSYGGATVGRMVQNDDRVRAGLAMAAPLANPLMGGVDPESIDIPVGLLVAVEDNSITELGNELMREDYEAVTGPATKLEVEDAGHWSFSDILGIHEDFMPGCGEDERQTNSEPFTYLDPGTGRAAAADFSAAFFRWHLNEDSSADSWLEEHTERR